MAVPTTMLGKIKLRLGITYEDTLKNAELTGRIEACKMDLVNGGVPSENLESDLALDTIERYIRGGQNDPIYIANVIKLRGIEDV